MTDYVWPADIAPFAMGFSLQPHTGGTESPFSRVSKVYGLSAPRWVAKMSLRAPESADKWGSDYAEWGERLDAFLDKLKGRQNRVILWDYRREGAVATFSNQAVNTGDSVIYLNGAVLGDVRKGQYVGGDGRPHRILDVRPGGPSPAGLTVAVEPPYGAYVAPGSVTAFRVAGTFRLTSDGVADVMSTVGELTPYDIELVEDIDFLGASGVSFYDEFSDTAGERPDRRDVQYRSLYGAGIIPTMWRLLAGNWSATGTGYISPSSVPADTNNMLFASLFAPAGTASDRKITVVLNSSMNFRPGIVPCTDGRYFVTFEYTNIGSGVRIRQGDMQAAAPTYSSSANSWTLLGSGTLSSYDPTEDQTFELELSGTTLTVTHINSGTVIQNTTPISVPIGPYHGIYAAAPSVKFKSVKVEPVGTPTFYDIGNGVKLMDARVIDFLGDSDGGDVADTEDTGLPTLFFGNSSNQNNTVGGLYEYKQALRDRFERIPKDVNSNVSVTDRYTGTEGVCLVPISNYRYAFVNDTPTAGQLLFDRSTGDRIQLAAFANGQDCRPLTIDGETCIVSTHQGGTGASGIAHGGMVGFRYLGGDPMSLASWQQFTIVERPGAWALQGTNFGFVDIDGDSVADELGLGVRDNGTNTDVTAPGFYSVKKPVNPFAGPWTETARYVAADGADFLNWDFCDASGDGNGLDVVYGLLNESAAPKYLRKSTGYTSNAMVTIGLTSTHQMFNIKRLLVRGSGTRDGFLAWVAYRGFVHVYWDGAAWQYKVVRGENITHGWNACNGPYIARSDGSYSRIIGNSFGNALLDMRFK